MEDTVVLMVPIMVARIKTGSPTQGYKNFYQFVQPSYKKHGIYACWDEAEAIKDTCWTRILEEDTSLPTPPGKNAPVIAVHKNWPGSPLSTKEGTDDKTTVPKLYSEKIPITFNVCPTYGFNGSKDWKAWNNAHPDGPSRSPGQINIDRVGYLDYAIGQRPGQPGKAGESLDLGGGSSGRLHVRLDNKSGKMQAAFEVTKVGESTQQLSFPAEYDPPDSSKQTLQIAKKDKPHGNIKAGIGGRYGEKSKGVLLGVGNIIAQPQVANLKKEGGDPYGRSGTAAYLRVVVVGTFVIYGDYGLTPLGTKNPWLFRNDRKKKGTHAGRWRDGGFHGESDLRHKPKNGNPLGRCDWEGKCGTSPCGWKNLPAQKGKTYGGGTVCCIHKCWLKPWLKDECDKLRD